LTKPEPADKTRQLEAYVPGKTVDEIAEERGLNPDDVVKLSSNENPLGPPTSAINAVRELKDLHRYPSPKLVEQVEKAAASHAQVEPENVVVTPGADGAIDYLTRLFVEPGTITATPVPTLQYYETPVLFNGGDFVAVPTDPANGHALNLETVEKLLTPDPDILFLCTPNNPTGRPLEPDALDAAIDSDALVVLDEAYAEFSDQNHAPLVERHGDVAILRTLSKAFGLAGLRVGYAVVPEWMKPEIAKVATPLSVNLAGLAAAKTALNDQGHLNRSVETAEEGRRTLSGEMPFDPLPSEANFVAFDTSPHEAATIADKLMYRGAITRSCNSFPGDTENLLRVTAGTEEENRRAIRAAIDLTEEKR